jgi:hypothetical protein
MVGSSFVANVWSKLALSWTARHCGYPFDPARAICSSPRKICSLDDVHVTLGDEQTMETFCDICSHKAKLRGFAVEMTPVVADKRVVPARSAGYKLFKTSISLLENWDANTLTCDWLRTSKANSSRVANDNRNQAIRDVIRITDSYDWRLTNLCIWEAAMGIVKCSDGNCQIIQDTRLIPLGENVGWLTYKPFYNSGVYRSTL